MKIARPLAFGVRIVPFGYDLLALILCQTLELRANRARVPAVLLRLYHIPISSLHKVYVSFILFPGRALDAVESRVCEERGPGPAGSKLQGQCLRVEQALARALRLAR